jgi:ubiquinone/menaquinone biosynthesis C-methylase UbiE
MSDPTLQPQIDAAKAYEALFVPALFRQWAPIVADAAQIKSGQRVLDVACGTGVLARELSNRVGPEGQVVGIDATPGMIAVAKQLAPDIEWRQGTAESMPFPDGAFDAVVSQFGLMFMDRPQAASEMLRVLSQGGRLAVAVWDSLQKIPAYASVVALLEQTAGQQAADALRAPFVLGDQNEVKRVFSEAGAASIEVVTREGTAHFPSIRVMVEAELRGWLPVMGVSLAEDQISDVLNKAEHALSYYAAPDGQVSFSISAHVITASKS